MTWFVAETGWTAALAVAVAAALLAVCVVLEWRRQPRRLTLRVAAMALAVVSLLFLYLRPGRWAEAGSAPAVLLTPGADLEEASDDDGRVFALAADSGPDRRAIPDLAFLARHHPEVDHLRVLGHGLPAWEWEFFQGEVEIAGPAPFDAGVREIVWPRRLTLGEDFVVRGVVAGRAGEEGSLTLEGPGGTEDSVAVDGQEALPFELRARPRDAGRWLYRWVLETRDGAARVDGTLDVVVREPGAVNVLWLESAPGFETRFFREWLTDRGGAVAIRSRISRARFRTELHNLPAADLSRLTADLLARFDLAVLDPPTLESLRPSEVAALRSAVTERGLGALILAGPGSDLPDAWPRFAVEPVADLDEMPVAAVWPGAEPTTPLAVTAREIAPRRGQDPVVLDAAGRVLAAARVAGAGAVGLTLVHGSFRWVLEGNAEHHGRYWSRLIGALARRDEASRWRLPPGPILLDEPLELTLETAEPRPRASVAPEDGVPERLALRQDAREPRRWRARFWPRQPGWHRLSGGGEGGGTWFHVEDAGRWTAWQQARRQAATRSRAVLGPERMGDRAGRPRTARELPRSWLYAAFLACVGYLWAGERWRRRG